MLASSCCTSNVKLRGDIRDGIWVDSKIASQSREVALVHKVEADLDGVEGVQPPKEMDSVFLVSDTA